jgi:hypothetical protein
MSNNDDSFEVLLELLKQNREIIREIVFHPERIPAVLAHKKARKLLRDAPSAAEFLKYMVAETDGYPIAFCYCGTRSLCGKGSLFCVGGTKPNVTTKVTCA